MTTTPPVVLDLGTEDAAPAPDSLLFIGNATMLLRVGGLTVLTDPTFVHRHTAVDIGYGMSTTRLTDPAMDVADLPPLDLVLLSHLHGDHFDQVAEQELDHALPVVTTGQAAKELRKRGFANATGVDTWREVVVTRGGSRLSITACPARHGPGITDLVLPDVMGSVLEWTTPQGVVRRLYISGDTLVHDALHEVPRRWPDLDVGVLHLGGTKVLGILVTMDAEQGVEAMQLIGAGTTVPVHNDDYDVFTSSLEQFLQAASVAGVRDRVRPVDRGETIPL